ncbi:MAG TPA: carboxypeptidase regulatory-like domain-containing protein [Candidatus Acidoferrales bacterium]|nr:carboxypeptidase regulatory-like domain-containing protein [Candidatus Acidoferrales bacterium]
MRRIFALILLVCFPLLYTGAQTTAQVSGAVLDASGAAVAGAQVQISNTDTNAVRTATSGDDGSYSFPNLPIGPYKLEVSKSGFTTYVQSGIVLQVGTNPTVNVTLQVGAVTQTVEVQANAAMVETQSNAGLGQVIQPEQVVDLPLNGRQATQLIALSGAAVVNNGGGLTGNLEYPTAVSFSIAGSQGNATNYYLDGSLNMDYRTNIGEPMPFPDALQEFKVESSASPANVGIRPGGTVNAAVKSGTNQFHGDLFDYLRNTAMDAYPSVFIQSNGKLPPAAPDNLKRNQFGGTIGGPVIKNKLFFFYGYQGTRERVAGGVQSTIVPTAAALSGDFTAMLAPPCQSSQIFLGDSYVTAHHSNILLPSLLTTPSALITAKLIPYLPAPTDACGDASYNTKTSDDENQSVIRADWQQSQNNSVFLRYFITNYTLFPYYADHDVLTAGAPGLSDRVQSVDIGDTKIISPNLISSLRLAFLRTATVRTAPIGVPTWSQLGAAVTTQTANFTGQNSISGGYATPNAPRYPGYDYENTFEISDTIGWTRGAHQMTFGFQGEHIQMNNDGLFQVNANLTFNGSLTGNGLADFLTGNAFSIRQGNGQLGRDSQNVPALFFQDNWKVSRTFQVNGGLRWDPFIPQYTKYKQASDFSLAAYQAGTISSIYPNAPPGVTFPGDAGFNEKSDTNPQIWNFAPRLGFVWDPRGNGRETLRAGYGMFYDTSVLWNTMHIVLNPPWGLTVSNTSVPAGYIVNPNYPTANCTQTPLPTGCAYAGTVANPWNGFQGGNPFPSPLNPPSSFVFPQHGTYVFEDQGSKPSNVQQWNVAFQKQFGANWLLSASYLGSRTSHQWLGRNMNPSVVITSGMTSAQFPALLANNVVAGSPDVGSCTIQYGAQQVMFNPCNGNANANNSVSGVTNNQARKFLNLLNPVAGSLLDGGLVQDFSNGNATYNGLLVSAQHRMSQNFSILANFTWSHCLDQGEIGQDIGNAFQNPNDRRADWGNCANDRRKIVNLSVVAQSPHHGDRLLQAILGNWQGSGIFTAASGSPLNITTGEDASLTAVGADRPVEIANPFVAGSVAANPNPGCQIPLGTKVGSVNGLAPTAVYTLKDWFNPCAFVMAPLGSYGTLGRNALQGPGNWNFDAAIWRTFPIGERFKLDFRAEAFNAFNHNRIGNPGAGLFTGNLNAGNPNGATARNQGAGFIASGGGDQRIMQLALKLTF